MSDAAGLSRGAQLLEEWQGDGLQVDAAKLLDLDEPTYSRFLNGVRKPSAQMGFRIERLTDGHVTAKSWYEPPIKQSKRDVA